MIVAVQPVGAVAEGAVHEALDCVREQFCLKTRLKRPQPDPQYAWDAKRQQYNSFELMRALVVSADTSADRVLGVTECDLFIPALTFVFGQAQLDGKVALVSLARLRQRFYGMPDDPDLFRLRLRKEVTHEVGHTLGLIHCPVTFCAMRLSTSIIQVDVKEDRLCDSCRQEAMARIARWRSGDDEIAMADPGR